MTKTFIKSYHHETAFSVPKGAQLNISKGVIK